MGDTSRLTEMTRRPASVFKVAAIAVVIAASFVLATSSALATIFPVEGGKGARGEIVTCPDGYLLSGFHGAAGKWIDRIGLVCTEFRPPDYTAGDAQKLSPRGGPGGGLIEQYCDNDGAIRLINISIFEEGHLVGATPKVVWKIDFSCSRPKDGSGAGVREFMGINEVPGVGSDRIREVAHQCPGNEYATGLSIRYGKDVNGLGLVCGPASVSGGPAVSAERIDPGMENDTNRPFSDFDRFHINDNRPDRCQSECLLRRDRCKAWSYVRPGIQHKYAVCYLKDAVPKPVSDKCCISGVLPSKPRSGITQSPGGFAPNPGAPPVEPSPPKGQPPSTPQAPPSAPPANPGAGEPYGSIGDKYAALGGAGGPLGAPTGNEADAPHGGRCQQFRGGMICWHPEIGEAFGVWGLIHAKWASIGRTEFGYPITDERVASDGRGRYNHFRGMQYPGRPEASIFWTPQTGAHAIYGAIRDAWAQQGWERGPLGYPTSDEHQDGKYRRVNFERGYIRWAADTGIEIGR